MPFGKPDVFEVKPIPGWGNSANWAVPQQEITPEWHDNEELKKLFGVELAKNHPTPFAAAMVVFKGNSLSSLWVTRHWGNDPIVIGACDTYKKTVGAKETLLDKDQLAATLLEFAKEKTEYNGREVYVMEAKDRLAALKLYSEVMGFTGKVEIDNSSKKFVHNELIIQLVEAKPQEEQLKTIVHKPQPEEHLELDNNVELDLVG